MPYTVQIPITALKNGQHTITVYAEDAAGNIGNAAPVKYTTFYVAPPPQTPNLILNPSFEDISASGAPLHWLQGNWGTNTVQFNYPIVGGDGGRAAEVNMTAWTSGDAKWYFEDIKVIPGEIYTFTEQYKSTVPTTLNIRYTNTDGTISNYVLARNIPASPTWQTTTQSFTIPANVTSLTIFHYIDSVGTLAIDNAKLSL